jgi:hypothetical protein
MVRSLMTAVLVTGLAHAAVRPVSFNAPQAFRVSSPVVGTVIGDFNGDGKPDVALINSGVSILLGDGRGGFRTGARYALASVEPYSIAMADFNGDGKLDLVVVGVQSKTTICWVLLGNGDGTFRKQAVNTGNNSSYSVAVGDFNGDGKPDLALVSGAPAASAGILLGNGDGTFQPPISYPMPGVVGLDCCLLAVGDFNGDGHLDLVVANNQSDGFAILLGKGDGTFQPPVTHTTPGYYDIAVVAADFNGDGKLDLAISDERTSNILVLLGEGDGTFQAPLVNPVPGLAGPLAVADLNGDHIPDFVVSPGEGQETAFSTLIGNGDGTFQSPVAHAVGAFAGTVSVADLNGDGIPDVVLGADSIGVVLGKGGADFQHPSTFSTGSNPSAVASGDFNGDGKPDLVVANHGSNDVSILLGGGDGIFQPQVKYAVGTGPSSVVVQDLNGDGKPDLVVANSGSEGVSVLLGNGDGTFKQQVSYATQWISSGVAVGDVSGDGKPDLIVSIYGTQDMAVLLGNGDGTFQAPRRFSAGGQPGFVTLADFDGDGKLDIAVMVHHRPTPNASGVAILLGNGDGTFQAPVIHYVSSTGGSFAVGDFGRDGQLDLVVTTDSGFEILLGQGKGFFKKSTPYTSRTGAYAVADFNGDGHPDVISAGNGVVTLLLGQGKAAPVLQHVNYLVGYSYPTTIAVADFNGDGKLDVAVPDSIRNSVTVLTNTTR